MLVWEGMCVECGERREVRMMGINVAAASCVLRRILLRTTPLQDIATACPS